MKKLLFIIILATTFIPVPQTGASKGDMNVSDNYKAAQAKTKVMQTSINGLLDETLQTSDKIKKEERKSLSDKQVLTKKSVSSERKYRLLGLLLMTHGGRR